MDYYTSGVLASLKQAINEPKESKYYKKIMGSVNRHLTGNKYASFPEVEVSLLGRQFDISKIHSSTETCEETEYQDSEQMSDNSTRDSGIMTGRDSAEMCKSPFKKISFSLENNKVIEIETCQPKYYDIAPQKLIAHISETPKLEKVEYKTLNSTPVGKCNGLTKDVLQSANLIRDLFCDPEYVLDLSAVGNTPDIIRSPSDRSVDEKFVVNLFESRPSKRWKKKKITYPSTNTAHSIIDNSATPTNKPEPDSHTTSYSEAWVEPEILNDDEMFYKLKKERDVECVKMVQTSNVLKAVRKNPHMDLSDELLVEKLLLETVEKYSLIVNQIRNLGYTEAEKPKPDHIATVTLSNFEFLLNPEECSQSKYSVYFIISLSHGTNLLMSKVVSEKDNRLLFDENFTLSQLNFDFKIILKIYMIKLRNNGKPLCSFLGRKNNTCCPMSRIYYENVNTYEMKESVVLKPSFKCIGELVLTRNEIGNTHFVLSNIPLDSRLLPDVDFSFQIDNLRIHSTVRGFLTLGLPNRRNEVLFWERKWCALNGTKLNIYNYPVDEDIGKPVLSIDLGYCFTPLQTSLTNCARKKTFLLKTGIPSALDSDNSVALRKKSNFVLERYYFTADNSADFELWTSELQSILDCLTHWKKLEFFDDYY